jgi:hypothetical protein
MTPADDYGGEEFSEFLFEAKQRPDGTTPDDADEARRKRAIQLHAQRLAEKHGFTIETGSVCPGEPVTPTARHAEIAAIAREVMPARDATARTTLESAEIVTKDGLRIRKNFVQLGFLDSLGRAIEGLLNPIGITKAVETLSKRVKRISIRVGPLIHAEADFADKPGAEMTVEVKPGSGEPVDAE